MSATELPDPDLHENGILTLAVMSDLHAFETANLSEEERSNCPSFLNVSAPEDQPSKHPIAGLKKLINQEGLQADSVFCGGDLGEKAHPTHLKYAWEKLHDVTSCLNASRVFVTSGNHDVDSRYEHNDYDAKGYLQSLNPPYPFPSNNLNDRYWSRHFVILTNSVCRIVLVNSAAYHGNKPSEYEYGRLASRSLDKLKEALSPSPAPPINILLCHHHPEQQADESVHDAGDYQVMKGGPSLVQALGSGDFGSWLLIHGHWHRPRLYYASGSSSSPVVFSAGSLCARLYGSLQTTVRNQFYLVRMPIEECRKHGARGTFRSWDWADGAGWLPAGSRSGLPAEGGFGCRSPVRGLAEKLRLAFAKETRPFFADWSNVVGVCPEVQFLLPENLRDLARILEQDHGFSVFRDEGMIAQIGKST